MGASRVGLRCTALLALAASAGCGLFGATEEPRVEPEKLPVVADEGPFDPSQAVDHDPDEQTWERTSGRNAVFGDGEADGRARAHGESAGSNGDRSKPADASGPAPAQHARERGGEREREHGAAPSSAAPPSSAAAPEKAPHEPARAPFAKLPADEHVASPAEVQQLIAERRQRLDRLAKQEPDDEAKAQLAQNPPPEPVGEAKSVAWTLLDYTLETLLLGTVAVAVTALIALGTRYPKTAVVVTAAALLLVFGAFALETE